MKIFVGYDHNGTKLAYQVMEYLVDSGYEVNEPYESKEGDDYPDIAKAVCENMLKNKGSKAILFCGTGIGMAMACNRNNLVRAVLAQTEADAYFAVRHEDANVLVLAGGYADGEKEVKPCKKTKDIISAFLTTEFQGEERHQRRIEKLKNLYN